jgi:peptide/nickel transport system permease protein
MLTWAIGMLSGLSFLGYGVAPPAADWGLMINENRAGLMIQPWSVLAPIAAIALFALGTNLIAEGASRAGSRISTRKVRMAKRSLMRTIKRQNQEQAQ